jgi:type IV secretory pathway VirB4 component
MYMVLQFIWNEMRTNQKRRLVLVDEAWVMMKYEDAASFLFGLAKRCRKYFTGLTTITQDVNDFLSSRYGKAIVTNSSLQLLLKQSPAGIDVISDTFYLTNQEKFLLLESNVGEGIFFAGTNHVAIKVVASYSEDQIITTDPSQLLDIDRAKKEFSEEEG